MPSYDNPAGDARPGAKVADDFEVSGEFTFTPTADEVGEDVTLTWNVTTQTAGTCVGQDPTAESANATLTVHVVAADSTSQPSTTPSASPSASATPAAPGAEASAAIVRRSSNIPSTAFLYKPILTLPCTAVNSTNWGYTNVEYLL